MKYTKAAHKTLKLVMVFLLCCTFALAQTFSILKKSSRTSGVVADAATTSSAIKKIDTSDIDVSLDKYYDDSVVYQLSDTIEDNQDISVIVSLSEDSLLTIYNNRDSSLKNQSISDFASTVSGQKLTSQISSDINTLKRRIQKAGISCTFGEEYNILLSGFEVTLKAKYFNQLSELLSDKATLIVGEVYEECDSQVVENTVDIDESTGIFDSTDSKYDGSGTVIAVLDTGLDYTHTAFDVSRFTGEEVLTTEVISEKISRSAAASYTAGLTASDVYINAKVPYAYDYADKDSDVYPLNSEHGTHVSGVIVGNDDTIRGVSPNAQLVSMKVFSDITDGSKTSWLLAALQDCVLLEVDVINMSLGSSCGFSNSQDNLAVEEIYNQIEEAGISLVVSASNSYSSSQGSTKNGNLALTSNPDTATVGSPSTFSAALSVASISGVKTPYLLYNNQIIYFTEASDQSSNTKDFVNEILAEGETTHTYEYVTIPGVGRSADYSGMDVSGKIALVKRGGGMTFEEKVKIAKNKGAVGIIIYNNVSGEISMTVGSVDLPACSVSQDDGEVLAAQEKGTITISTSQVAGPFMSNFSSWGPTPDLKIKPEITAHGGDILSSVPGQKYERMSGTSMSAPNQAGVTALVRQYVKENFPNLETKEITARVNQLMMSTADIIYNKNGLPYSVRKQGAGLANLAEATSTPAFVSTYDTDGNEMDKAKLELGDDAQKTGVYTMTFAINNISSKSLTYKVGAIVMTEGVSETLTVRGDTTVTEDGYLLGASVEVKNVVGGTQSGSNVTVSAGTSAKVTVTITLTDADKEYLDKSFSNGMYIEGFVTLTATDGTDINLNVPYLAFYGDWNQAPIFDLDYFETNADELNSAIDDDEKTMADAYATTPIGGLYNDHIAYLGSYMYVQDSSATQIAASRDHIALTNQTGESGGINSIYAVWAGMLRGADHIDITITDDVTGEVIYSDTQLNQRKSYNYGSSIRMSSIDFDFSLEDYDLKNNTRYTVKLVAYTAYGDGGLNENKRNTFEFTFTTDFEAPAVTDCEYYTEYDATTKKTRLFANIKIYDNHYSQAAAVGMIVNTKDESSSYYDPDSEYTYSLQTFDKYLTPLYSSFNSTYVLTYELTDYIDQIKNSYNGNSIIVQVIDYALNSAVYELEIPDSILGIQSFLDTSGNAIESLTLSPNEVYEINLSYTPNTSWLKTVTFTSSDENIVGIVNGKLVARSSGTATITAVSNSDSTVTKELTVTVLSETDEGYRRYDKPVTDSFTLTEYYIEKAYYFVSSSSRELGGITGSTVKFKGSSYSLSFYPSESVTIHYDLKAYFPDATTVEFTSSNPSIVTVTEDGTITAVSEGSASISVRLLMDGKSTYYSQTILITVKNPYSTSAIYLMQYYGLGGTVEIPDDLGITEIYQYAFSNYEYVPKTDSDEISDEDPGLTKISPIGENTITKVIIPEGVKTIDTYAFAYLTALEEVVLPSTLTKIQSYAFIGCTKLKKINLENVQFINQSAFYNCPIEELDLSSIVAIGNSAFEMDADCKNVDGESVVSKFDTLVLPVSAQSLGSRAFYNNTALNEVDFKADSVKLGSYVFAKCSSLTSASVNASVIPSYAFADCTKLNSVTIGKDVSVIGQYAFSGTAISKFVVDSENKTMKAGSDGTFILSADGTTVVLVAPAVRRFEPTQSERNAITTVGNGAFSGNSTLTIVNLPNVTTLGDYAFAFCTSLSNLTLGNLTSIGSYAFIDCESLNTIPDLSNVKEIGDFAFAYCTKFTSINIADDTVVGEGAFRSCSGITTVKIGNNVQLGDGAFFATVANSTSPTLLGQTSGYYLIYYNIASNGGITSVEIGDNVSIGDMAFYGQTSLATVTLGANAKIGSYAFYMNGSLENIDLSKVLTIGDYAFAGYSASVYACTYSSSSGYTSQGVAGYYPVQSPRFTSVDLSSVTTLGSGAFGYNTALTSVTMNEALKEIGAGAFYYCTSLTNIDLKNVETLGVNAFYGDTSLKSVDLSSATSIGSAAFYGATSLEEVKLASGVEIGSAAFYGDTALVTINLEVAKSVGSSAFSGATALTSVDLTSAESIGSYAFNGSGVTSVKLGSNLTSLGENPFANVAISAFTSADGETTFVLSDKVFVEDGVLYSVAPNGGYVLVSYPKLKADIDFTAKSGTVRISAGAFAYNENLVSVELPYELAAIGDKAFYQCNSLTVVTFKSLSAPILEEQYDTNYQSYSNLPLTGYYAHMDENEAVIDALYGAGTTASTYKGLGIVPFFMWNDSATSYYYGANFINYVGKQTKPLVFVTPSNGQYYNAFVISQYYTKNVAGAVAPYQATLNAINAIAALPDYITLSDKAQVESARELYGLVTSLEQQALVTNYSKLTSAENTIQFLTANQTTEEPETPTVVEEQTTAKNYVPAVVTLAILTGLFALSTIALAVLLVFFIKGKKSGNNVEVPKDESDNA